MSSPSRLFREEALAYHLRGSRTHGDLLRLSPRWAEWTYWYVVAVCVVGLIYSFCGRLNEYATGIAVIRDEGRTIVTTRTEGTITEIAVQRGHYVEANDVLFRLHDVDEKRELARLHKAFHLQHIQWLKTPQDAAAQQQLAALRAQLDTAEKRLQERTVFAPSTGIVRDIRLRLHQRVAPGEVLCTLVKAEDGLSVVAILPGQYRPFLAPGRPLQLELTGFRSAYQHLTITTVGNEVVGPSEVRRFLGQDIADAVPLQGSSVIVQAQVPARQFYAAGRWHDYHDGMHGTAEVRVRSERLVLALVPGLKAVLESTHAEDTRIPPAR